MPSSDFNIDTFLDSDGPVLNDSDVFKLARTEGSPTTSYVEPGYEGKIDYRIRQLSYSSRGVLNSCKRKFQLNRLRTTHRTAELEETTITFAFGHVVGDGIQKVLEGKSEEEIIWAMFLGWHAPLMAVDEKRKKSFWSAIFAIQKFIVMRDSGFLDDYEVLIYNGKPATELDFCIILPDGFRFRGSVDVVFIHKINKSILVLEVKTTWYKEVNPATYKNSSQGIGYSIVLDVIYPGLSSYEVLYLVYSTSSKDYIPIPYTKSYTERAMWIRELLMDVEIIKFCEEQELYPKNGGACMDFGKECEYINHCGMATSLLTKPCTIEDVDVREYQINLDLMDLVTAQIDKVKT